MQDTASELAEYQARLKESEATIHTAHQLQTQAEAANADLVTQIEQLNANLAEYRAGRILYHFTQSLRLCERLCEILVKFSSLC